MADYRTGSYAGHPHYWCGHCHSDFSTVEAIEAHVAARHRPDPPPTHPPVAAPAAETVTVAESPAEHPPHSAPKDAWIAYAESLGVDTEGLTKTQLIERST